MSKELEDIFKQDQQDRLGPLIGDNPKELVRRDRVRRRLVLDLLKDGKVKTGREYYIASMVLHHRPSRTNLKKARTLAKRSARLGYEKAKWLYAAVIDRLQLHEGKPQKYGTQFFRQSPRHKWIHHPLDPQTTDKERAVLNVPPLREMKQQLKRMNRR